MVIKNIIIPNVGAQIGTNMYIQPQSIIPINFNIISNTPNK
jgi:hypothetical protein